MKIKGILKLLGIHILFGATIIPVSIYLFVYNYNYYAEAMFVHQIILVFFLYWLFRRTRVSLEFENTNVKNVLIALLLGVAVFGMNYTNTFFNGSHENDNTLLGFLKGVMFAPILEELYFRLWMTKYMSRHGIGTKAICLISSVLFWLGHIHILESNVFGSLGLSVANWRIDTLFVAILLFVLYKKTNDIRYSIIAHSLANLLVNLFI